MAFLVIGTTSLCAADAPAREDAKSRGTATAIYGDTRQRIDGFGASSAWIQNWTEAEADLFFSTKGKGIGLSLLRSRIAPDGTSWETKIMKMAQARGATVWSTPWSPPVKFKSGKSVNGGTFVASPENCREYAAQLARYVGTMKKSFGIDLSAISVQNEPDLATDYESCGWTAGQIHEFVPYLRAALDREGAQATRIVLPEGQHWEFSLAKDTMEDPKTAAAVGIVGGHPYGSTASAVPLAGKLPLWQTEHFFGKDDSIVSGMELAREIHEFLTVAGVNAYHYWWLKGSGTGSLAGNSTAKPAKRLFVMGHYSRFVRPGFVRVGVTNDSPVLVTAFKDPASERFVLVAANSTAAPVTQTFVLAGFPAAPTMDRWVTSAALSLSKEPPVVINGGTFTAEIPAESMVTFTSAGGPAAATAEEGTAPKSFAAPRAL